MWRSLKGSSYLGAVEDSACTVLCSARSARGQQYFGGGSYANR